MDRLARRGYGFSVEDFHRAARAGDAESVQEFLTAGMAADVPDEAGMTALGAACEGNGTEVARVLLKSGAKVSAPVANGRTPIMLAAAGGSGELVRLLMENGADARARDAEGWHPLVLATWNGRTETANVLAAQATAGDLDDALLLASLQGNVEMTDLLLRRGASVLAEDAEGRTPLMIAASHGHVDVARRLMDNGANRFALQEETGWTPSQFAVNAEATALAAGDPAKAVKCRTLAELLSTPPPENGEAAGVFEDPREVVAVPHEGPDEVMAVAIADGRVRVGQPVAAATLPVAKPGFDGLAESWRVAEYRERPAPVILASVAPDGRTARFRQLFGAQETVEAKAGQNVPGTTWRLVEAKRVIGKAKDDGAPVDLSSVTVEIGEGGPRRVFVAGNQGVLEEPVAVLAPRAGGELVLARSGDIFHLAGDPAPYRINDIGPDGITVENLETKATHTMRRK